MSAVVQAATDFRHLPSSSVIRVLLSVIEYCPQLYGLAERHGHLLRQFKLHISVALSSRLFLSAHAERRYVLDPNFGFAASQIFSVWDLIQIATPTP